MGNMKGEKIGWTFSSPLIDVQLTVPNLSTNNGVIELHQGCQVLRDQGAQLRVSGSQMEAKLFLEMPKRS